MINANNANHKKPSQRAKINQRRCIVCGEMRTILRGQLFYQSGRSRFGAPFCKEHSIHYHEYAHPVFENKRAFDLFKFMFPKSFQKNVEGKLVLFFDTYKHVSDSKWALVFSESDMENKLYLNRTYINPVR